MLWYGLEPLAPQDPQFVNLIAQARLPRVQRLGARRLAEAIDTAPQPLDSLLAASAGLNPGESGVRAILDGVAEGLAGRRKVARPASWSALETRLSQSSDAAVRNRLRDLGALFGDGRALDEIRAVALNGSADLPQRRRALQALIDARPADLRTVCEKLLPVRDLSATAAAGLALFDDPAVADRLLAEWPNLYGHERPSVLNALLARPASAAKLLEAMARGKVSRAEVGVFQARQIKAFNDPALSARLRQVWGEIQDLDEGARRRALAQWKERLTPAALAAADLRQGQATFQVACTPCHRLYGAGGTLGPDLTGTGRDQLDYLLENLLFPSALIPADYRQTTIMTKDGRVLTGVVRSRAARTLTLEQVGETTIVETADIQREETSNQSLMPEGLLDGLDEGRARALIRFLMAKEPVK
jgi:putative heme-binding domain-containing protein